MAAYGQFLRNLLCLTKLLLTQIYLIFYVAWRYILCSLFKSLYFLVIYFPQSRWKNFLFQDVQD